MVGEVRRYEDIKLVFETRKSFQRVAKGAVMAQDAGVTLKFLYCEARVAAGARVVPNEPNSWSRTANPR